MDTFTARQDRSLGRHQHRSAQGFCSVCGTAWPCWRGLREASASEALRRSGPPLLVA